MSQVNAIRIKNLRSLNNTGFIEIKPITILVGKNSAGKSTFARVFPLLRQSVEENKRAPILWYGRLVDFGAFPDALNKSGNAEEIEFSFRIPIVKNFDPNEMSKNEYFSFRSSMSILNNTEAEISLQIKKESGGQGTYASKVEISLFGNSCSIEFLNSDSVSRIVVNDFAWQASEEPEFITQQRNLIPKISFIAHKVTKDPASDEPIVVELENPFSIKLKQLLSQYIHGNTSAETIERMIEELPIGDDAELIRALALMPNAPPSWRNHMNQVTSDSDWFKRTRNLIFAYKIEEILSNMDLELAGFFSGIRYLEPLRASAQRYYRRQELAVDEIDSKGANVAMYLDSLSHSEKDSFEEWTKIHFGVTISTTNEGGHIALKLKEVGGTHNTNLADMGFGFSQVLPIAVQLWSSTRSSRRRRATQMLTRRRLNSTCLVIEQPELHLHPDYQARLADIITAAMFKNDGSRRGSLSVIAETHSPNLINRLGQLVEQGRLNSEDVQIVLFEKQSSDSDTQISISNFDSSGVLQNWPFGFFEPEG